MVIGIGGISNAGKSSLAKEIKKQFLHEEVIILCQDDFVFPKNLIPEINGHINWEIPESIDFDRYSRELTMQISSNEIVITEGIFAFHNMEANKLIDKKIYLTLDRETFVKRKVNDLRWGKEPTWYIDHIWDCHKKYMKRNKPADALLVNANNKIDLKVINSFINSHIVK